MIWSSYEIIILYYLFDILYNCNALYETDEDVYIIVYRLDFKLIQLFLPNIYTIKCELFFFYYRNPYVILCIHQKFKKIREF